MTTIPISERQALEKLHTFDPNPSIILDSGGGWHAYWLLDPPYVLEDDEARQHIANILHGLFAAVGGDADYAKSVASLMRLPDSANTKPERGGVVAVITEFHPERRYPLSAFEWLAVKPGRIEWQAAAHAIREWTRAAAAGHAGLSAQRRVERQSQPGAVRCGLPVPRCGLQPGGSRSPA